MTHTVACGGGIRLDRLTRWHCRANQMLAARMPAHWQTRPHASHARIACATHMVSHSWATSKATRAMRTAGQPHSPDEVLDHRLCCEGTLMQLQVQLPAPRHKLGAITLVHTRVVCDEWDHAEAGHAIPYVLAAPRSTRQVRSTGPEAGRAGRRLASAARACPRLGLLRRLPSQTTAGQRHIDPCPGVSWGKGWTEHSLQ